MMIGRGLSLTDERLTDAEGGMICWPGPEKEWGGGGGIVEGCVGVLLAHLRFTHPIWGQRQQRERMLSETLGRD